MATGDIVYADIIGTDGKSPVIVKDQLGRVWLMPDVYMGKEGEGKYVPKVGDMVNEPVANGSSMSFKTYFVTGVDQITLIPKLLPINGFTFGDGESSETEFGLNAATTNRNTYVAYFKNDIRPNILKLDSRLVTADMDTTKAKIYYGTDITDEANCISRIFDNQGNLLGSVINLINVGAEYAAYNGRLKPIKEVFGQPSQIVQQHKSVPSCSSSKNLKDGDLITLVLYDDLGTVTTTQVHRVINSNIVPEVNKGTKYIRDMFIETPFLSSTDPKLIEYPINVPLQSLFIFARVEFNNGTIVYPIDGTKVSVSGLDQYHATVPGQKTNLFVTYHMSENEEVEGTGTVDDKKYHKAFKCVALPFDEMYSVKLFCVPTWTDAIGGYRLKWFLYTLGRDVYYDVSHLVRFNPSSPAFDPTLYGVDQKLSVRINLGEVTGSFKNFIHTQVVLVLLKGDGNSPNQSNWEVAYDLTQIPKAGASTYGTHELDSSGKHKLNLGFGVNNFADWLDKIYYPIMPLFHYSEEAGPILPTHFVVITPTKKIEFPVTKYRDWLEIDEVLRQTEDIQIAFQRKTASITQELGVTGVISFDNP